MAFRKRMSRRKSKKNFRKGAKVHKKNIHVGGVRGGYRM